MHRFILITVALIIPFAHVAEAQQGQRTYKYLCKIISPPELVRMWKAQRGEDTTAIMFNMPAQTVYALSGMFRFTATDNRISWTYETLFTHRQMTGRFDRNTLEMDLEDAHWRCTYEGTGP